MSSYPFQIQAQPAWSTPCMNSFFTPYLYQTLQSVIRREVAIQTTQGNVRGNVVDVLTDHVVLQTGGSTFFVRIQLPEPA